MQASVKIGKTIAAFVASIVIIGFGSPILCIAGFGIVLMTVFRRLALFVRGMSRVVLANPVLGSGSLPQKIISLNHDCSRVSICLKATVG